LVEFYAPWCGHCKKLAPEFAAAAETLSKNDPPFSIAKLDATEHKKSAEEFGIQGFPTLKWFHNGEATEYQGGRTADAIVSWILKKTGPASAELTCAQVAEKSASDKFSLVYFGALDNALYTEAHVKLAENEEKIQFYHADASCGADLGVSGDALVFFRQFETKQNNYDGAADKDSLQAWIKPLQVPTVFAFTEDEIEAVFGQQQSTLILFRSEDDDQADYMNLYREAAVANKGKILFAYAGTANQIQGKLAEFMGVTPEDFPTLRAIFPSNMKKYIAEGNAKELTVESVGAFVDGINSGSLKPHLKSAAIPAEQGAVIDVVGVEFEKYVLDETKDVLVKYYAPWCGHCKKLAPIWEELGEAYKDNENLIIAKFDATTNEADGVEVRGYPTLMWYPKDNKAGVTYEGERDLPAFKKWLEENSAALKEGSAKQEEL